MSDDPLVIANKQLAKLSALFVGSTPAKKRHVPKPCLVCGRPCKYALRIHPNCEAKVSPEAADQLRASYFKNWRDA